MLFSILIPAYKKAYLREAIESVLSQSFGDWELVLLNDCSPEDLKSVIGEYKDGRIKYFENETNCGSENVVDNWNKCLSESSGTFVICMGDDDKLCDDALNLYSQYIAKYSECDVFHSPSILIDGDGKELYVTHKRPERESAVALMRHRFNGEEQFIGDFCYRRSTLIQNGGFYKLPLAWGSDDVSALENAKEHGVVNLQVPVFFYRMSGTTISRNGSTELKLKALCEMEIYYRHFLCKTPEDRLDALETVGARNKLENYFFKRKVFTLAEDLSTSEYRFFRWLICRKEFQLSIIHVLLAFGVALRNRSKIAK